MRTNNRPNKQPLRPVKQVRVDQGYRLLRGRKEIGFSVTPFDVDSVEYRVKRRLV